MYILLGGFLRSVAENSLKDHKRNEDIRKELHVYNLNERLKENKNNWYEHLRRMDETRIAKRMFNYRPQGRRNVGRPRRRWTDDIL